MIRDIQDKIIKLKRERDVCILAHSYMTDDICEVADFVGDSYALSVKAGNVPQGTVIMCGVRFMAETVKMLCPGKRVYLANPSAGCPMAEQFDAPYIEKLRAMYPGYAVVAYVNTTAEIKAVSDVCVTSSSAVKICRNIPERNIIFVPDINLGSYVRSQVPEKNFVLVHGGCPVHAGVTEGEVLSAKASHPGALLLVHPECGPDVVKHADYVGSTAGIESFAVSSDAGEFIIGTENAIVSHLRLKCPGKRFHPLSKDLICRNMKITTLSDVLDCLEGRGGEETEIEKNTADKAVRCIERMIEYGG